ncbi:Hypothetical predicted protein, partial [Podarcis lilfordi]
VLIGKEHPRLQRSLPARMLWSFTLLFLLPPVVCKAAMRCPETDTFPVPHEWYQSGGLIIGGIASQFYYSIIEERFIENPSQNLFDNNP